MDPMGIRVRVYYSSGKYAWSRQYPSMELALDAAEAFRNDKRRYKTVIVLPDGSIPSEQKDRITVYRGPVKQVRVAGQNVSAKDLDKLLGGL